MLRMDRILYTTNLVQKGKIMNFLKIFINTAAILTFIFLSGCSTKTNNIAHKQIKDTPFKKPEISYYSVLPPSEGSLWTNTGSSFFEDRRAKRAGDTVIIDIIENTSSSMDVNTKAEKSSTFDADIPNLSGYMRALESLNPTLRQGGNSKLLSADLASAFEGKGKSDRKGRITASIGAKVSEVLPNGNIVIVGNREMKVNNETQYITISGIARPEDITPDNRIKSTYLADAKISYFGRGILADKQKPGWLIRILDHVWPF